MWVWIIIAVIVIAGLLFWVKSGAKDNQADLSVDEETPEVSNESFDGAQDKSADESFDEAQDEPAEESSEEAQDKPVEEEESASSTPLADTSADKPVETEVPEVPEESESFGTEESPSDEEKIV